MSVKRVHIESPTDPSSVADIHTDGGLNVHVVNAGAGGDGSILDGVNPNLKATVTASNALKVDGSAVTQPVSDASGSLTVDSAQLPGSLDADGGLKVHIQNSSAGGDGAILDGSNPTIKATVTAGNALKVDGSAVTQPVSAASLPLPSGASTSANQTNGSQKTQIVDATGADMDLFKANDLYTGASDHGLAILGQDAGAPARYRMLLMTTAGAVKVDPVGTTAQPVTDNAGSLTVDSTQLPATLGRTTMAASVSVALASDQAALPVTDNNTTLSVDDGTGSLTVDSPGIPTTLGAKTSANSLGVVLASDQAAIPVTDNAGSLTVDGTVTANPTAAATMSHTVSAASTNATNVKGSAGTLYGYMLTNNNASAMRYVKFYDKATAPTVGTDTPKLIIGVPFGGAANVVFSRGVTFSLGIGFAITGGMANSDTTAVNATEVSVGLIYT